MFYRALSVKFLEGMVIEVTFQDGTIRILDMEKLIPTIPVYEELRNRKLFTSGHLDLDGYAIIWNDRIDTSVDGVFDYGEVVGKIKVPTRNILGMQIQEIREQKEMSQTELSKRTHIDQGDLSKIEDGQKNITLSTLERLADGLDCEIEIKFKKKKLDKEQSQ